ncbi:MAG: helix-turn-helix domain-containing protein [Oscillospiraceae bacterium]|nr:helix-turn-helix domain-containing protein [Oscillospiraceae bacterium]
MTEPTVFEEILHSRLAQLRIQKGVSARDMSLSIGQGQAYINNIENRKMLPSIKGLFYICEYLGITPKDFFDVETANPEVLNGLISDLKTLSAEQLSNVAAIVKDIKK